MPTPLLPIDCPMDLTVEIVTAAIERANGDEEILFALRDEVAVYASENLQADGWDGDFVTAEPSVEEILPHVTASTNLAAQDSGYEATLSTLTCCLLVTTALEAALGASVVA